MVRTARSVLKRWSLPVEPRSPAVNRGARHIETANGGRNAGIKRILNNCLTKASDLWYSIHRVTASFVWFFLVIKLYHKLLGLLLFFYHLCLISIVIIHMFLTNSFNSFLTTSSFSCIISLDMFLISFRMFVVVTSFYQSFLSMSIFLGSFLNLRIILYLIAYCGGIILR